MQYQNQILRFQAGQRSQHAAPDVSIERPPRNIPKEAGDLLVVLVDLNPPLSRRSRELRTLAAEAYWNSTGSIAGRLRRALSETNRYLVHANEENDSALPTSGSLTCAVFTGEELFLGQVGPANALLYHPQGPLELFPRQARTLAPLGITLPPVIHIGYAPIEPSCTFLLLAGPIASAQSLDRWNDLLIEASLEEISTRLANTVAGEHSNGSAVLVRCTVDAPEISEPPPQPWPSWLNKLRPTLPTFHKPISHVRLNPAPTVPVPPVVPASNPIPSPVQKQATIQAKVSTAPATPTPTEEKSPIWEGVVDRFRHLQLPEYLSSARSSPPTDTPSVPEMEEEPAPEIQTDSIEETDSASSASWKERIQSIGTFFSTLPRPSIPTTSPAPATDQPEKSWLERLRNLRWPSLPRFSRPHPAGMAGKAGPLPSRRALVRQSLQVFLPGQINAETPNAPRTAPIEQATLMSGLTLGVGLLIFILTFSTYFQYGGLKIQNLLKEARDTKQHAYESQSAEDWQSLLTQSRRILDLEPANREAQTLEKDARTALDALQSAAILDPQILLELGTASPAPRHLLVAGGRVYYLNPTTDEVASLQLGENGLPLPNTAPVTILKHGQVVGDCCAVNGLVDLAWMTSPKLPDGAVLIYANTGDIYIYTPVQGTSVVEAHHLPGDLQNGQITLMDTFNDHFFLVHRQLNQILEFAPINDKYNAAARPYFPSQLNPPVPLQNALDMTIDDGERLYLLLGDGSVHAYFRGSEDPSFEWKADTEAGFQPKVMTVENNSDKGNIYLADPQNELIIVLDKHSNILHKFRLQPQLLRSLEAMSVTSKPNMIYFVAENRIYAAQLPALTAP